MGLACVLIIQVSGSQTVLIRGSLEVNKNVLGPTSYKSDLAIGKYDYK
jgi:hypothetical protein